MNLPDFKIEANGPVSGEFLKRNVSDFAGAMLFIKRLPYARNSNKQDLLTVFSDQCGTCSTKHALLKQLADENNFGGLRLIMGLFKMNAHNTPSVAKTLAANRLDHIPEAHNYLRYNGSMVDCTKLVWNTDTFETDLLEEIEILPDQITEFKVSYHKSFLEKWLTENKNISYNLSELWRIREQCIVDLSH